MRALAPELDVLPTKTCSWCTHIQRPVRVVNSKLIFQFYFFTELPNQKQTKSRINFPHYENTTNQCDTRVSATPSICIVIFGSDRSGYWWLMDPRQYLLVVNNVYEKRWKKRFRLNICLIFRTYFYRMSQVNRRKACLALKKKLKKK